jgi:lipopolysaccharide/colanic/teichoic acid biosynthesis glycosyltransferase
VKGAATLGRGESTHGEARGGDGIKRAFDVVVSLALLIVLAPLLLATALGVRLSSPGPAIFAQTRAGRGGRPFTLYKFRSMHIAPATSIETSRHDPRVFRFGRFIREFHIDELPQLWNVLVGDMSLVGPRPTVPEQVARYTSRERGRLRVRPGLTGLAQVSGNNELPWERRIEVDLEYVRRAGLRTDLAILARTVRTVLRREGVYGADGRVRDRS